MLTRGMDRMGSRSVILSVLALTALLAQTAVAQRPAGPEPIALIDTALSRIGPDSILGRIERVRYEMMTQWLRFPSDGVTLPDLSSYEIHSDLRDYTANTWRYYRKLLQPGFPVFETVNIVNDTVAGLWRQASGWRPLNVAYVDEMHELFALTPDRLLLAARHAVLKAMPDTVIRRARYARIATTLQGWPTTIFIRRSDGSLAQATFFAAQPNDGGLAPYGRMKVEYRYAGVRNLGSLRYPTQWDVWRDDMPYKRMTVLSAAFNLPAMPDSFAIPDSTRARFFSEQNKPMWKLAVDSPGLDMDRIAHLNNSRFGIGAVKLGKSWLLLDAPGVPEQTALKVDWLKAAGGGSSVAGMVVTGSPFGGVAFMPQTGAPLYVAATLAGKVSRLLANFDKPAAGVVPVNAGVGRWLRVNGDSARIESVAIGDYPDAIVVYVPSLKWMYSGPATTPWAQAELVAFAQKRHWQVESFGNWRGMMHPVSPARS